MSATIRELASALSKLRAQLSATKKDLLEIQNLQNGLSESLAGVWEQPDIQLLPASPPQWKEFTSLVASARIPSISAQASEALSQTYQRSSGWLSNGADYSRWLGRGVADLCKQHDPSKEVEFKSLASFCGRSFTIGYADSVVDNVVSALALEQDNECRLLCLVSQMARHEQRQTLLATIVMISRRFLSLQLPKSLGVEHDHKKLVKGCASLLGLITQPAPDESYVTLVDWICKGPVVDVDLVCAVVAVLPPEERVRALEKVWQTFSDKLYVKHTAIVQQEALLRTLILLITASYRDEPAPVTALARSSVHTEGMSNRLGAQSEQARTLGLFNGTLVSELVDKPATRMKFEFDEHESRRLQSYRALLSSEFDVGSIADLRSTVQKPRTNKQTALVSRLKLPQATTLKKPGPAISVIEEINDGPSDDDDLPTYAKPDSDREDSDADDVSVRHSQAPKAPVYIRDLLAQLSSTDNANAHELALRTAPGLIRRKAGFGSELRDQALALVSAYANLQDALGIDGWQDLRVQGLTALVAACPHDAGPAVAAQVFAGDFSVSTRNALLLSMGLAGRALAGARPPSKQDNFPSKTLPARLHAMYLAETEHSAVAARFADGLSVSPPSRKSTSRLAREIPSALFFPLIAGAQAHLGSRAGALGKTTLPLLLQTLGLLLADAGMGTAQRGSMASELWSLALSLRARASSGPAQEAVLFALLGAVGAMDDARQVALEHGRALLETLGWAEAVLARLEADGVLGDEERRVQSLAAGVAVACKEIVDKHNRLLVGELAEYR